MVGKKPTQPTKSKQVRANSFTNLASGLGTMAAKSSHSSFSPSRHTDQQLVDLYEYNWLAKKAVRCVVDDIVYGGRVAADGSPMDTAFPVNPVVSEVLTYQMVVGGGVVFFDDGASSNADPLKGKPTRIIAIPKTTIAWVDKLITNPSSPWFGLPEFIKLQGGDERDKIHVSRLHFFPSWQPFRTNESFWRPSTLDSAYDQIVEAGVVIQMIEDLFHEKKTDTYKVAGLMDMCSSEEGTQQLLKRFALNAQLRSAYHATILDTEEDHIPTELSLSGVQENAMFLLTLVAGAFDIPVTRLLGVSPGGLNATGESDLQNYYQGVEAKKDQWLTPFYTRLDALMGSTAKWSFEPSRTLSDTQLADNDSKNTQTALAMVDTLPDTAIVRYLLTNTRFTLTPAERRDLGLADGT